MGGVPEMIVLFNLLLLISLNPNLSDSLPGEWVGGDGFSQFPALLGNVYVNPALADTQDCLSVNFRLFSDDYTGTKGDISSASFNIPVFSGFTLGGSFNILYDCNMQAYSSVSDSNYNYFNYFYRKGGIYRFGGYVTKSLGPLSLGIDVNLLNGKSDDIWWVYFEEYEEVYDRVSTYFRGYSVGLGFNWNIANLDFGGYFSPYQEIEKQYEDEEKEDFELDSPLRFGLNYSFGSNKNIIFSVDRRERLIGLNYGFLKFGYGRIYSMGNGVEVGADRFLGGLSLNISELPFSIMFENRKYSGDFADSEFIASIGISISGKGRKNEDKF
jgi:hypothetical protein